MHLLFYEFRCIALGLYLYAHIQYYEYVGYNAYCTLYSYVYI